MHSSCRQMNNRNFIACCSFPCWQVLVMILSGTLQRSKPVLHISSLVPPLSSIIITHHGSRHASLIHLFCVVSVLPRPSQSVCLPTLNVLPPSAPLHWCWSVGFLLVLGDVPGLRPVQVFSSLMGTIRFKVRTPDDDLCVYNSELRQWGRIFVLKGGLSSALWYFGIVSFFRGI